MSDCRCGGNAIDWKCGYAYGTECDKCGAVIEKGSPYTIPKQPRKIIHFEHDGHSIIALCDDGTIWSQSSSRDGLEWVFKCASPETQPAINPRVKDKLDYLERNVRNGGESLNALVTIDELKELLYGDNH